MGNAIGNKIYALRKANNMTQEELGKKVGVTKATINKYETGVVLNLRRPTIEALAKAFGVSPAYLMGWDELNIPRGPSQNETKDDEKELLKIYRALSIRDKVKLLSFAIDLEAGNT